METQSKFYTYILSCEDGSLYTGITINIEKRFLEHYFKLKPCAKYTKSHQVKNIEAVFESNSKSEASKLEYYIKHLTKTEKIEIVESSEDLCVKNVIFKRMPNIDVNLIIQNYAKKNRSD